MSSAVASKDNLQFQDEDGVKLAEWLESMLKDYCLNLTKQIIRIRQQKGSSPTRIRKSTQEEVRKNIYIFISSLKYEKFKGEMNKTTLDKDVFKVEISYYVGDRTVKRIENFVIHVCRSLESSEMSIEKMLESERREIDFYTILVPELEDWITSLGVPVKFVLPTCFFGDYEADELPPWIRFTFPTPQEEEEQAKICPIHAEEPPIENRSILVLQDLETTNFKTKGGMLNVEEAKAVLEEIAEIHAASWAYQRSSKMPFTEIWNFLLQQCILVPACVTLIEEGLSALLNCVVMKVRDDELLGDLTKRLKTLRPKLTSVLYDLLTPPEAPAPSCLIHLDLQHKNLFFRNINGEVLAANHQFKCDQIECRITQWKLVSFGSQMHDVAFLLMTSLTPEDRREYELELIRHYFAAFQRMSKQLKQRISINMNYLEHEYERSLFLALLLTIGNFEEGMIEVPDNTLDLFMAAIQDVIESGFL